MPKTYTHTPPRLTTLYQDNPLYFLTLCSYQRHKLFNNAQVFHVFLQFATKAYEAHQIAVGRFVIMPEHFHLFVRGPYDFRLGIWMGALKTYISKHGAFANLRHPVWQRGGFDHVLRRDESYAEKWAYVRMNPVRAGLVQEPHEWPYQGEIVKIDRA